MTALQLKLLVFRLIFCLGGVCLLGSFSCTDRHWENPLDSDNASIWMKLTDPPERSMQATTKFNQFIINDQIYFLATSSIHTIYRMINRAKGWTMLAVKPAQGSYVAAAVHEGKIYIVTGLAGRFGSTDYFLTAFDPSTDTFGSDVKINGNNGPIHALADCQNQLFALESGEVEPKTSLMKVELSAGNLAYVSSIPRGRREFNAVVVKNMIYMIGGFESGASGGLTDAVESFNVSDNTWKQNAPLPIRSNKLASAVVDGHIYVFDGDLGGVFKFDPENNEWETKSGHFRFLKFSDIAVVADGELILVTSHFIHLVKEYEIYVYNVLRD